MENLNGPGFARLWRSLVGGGLLLALAGCRLAEREMQDRSPQGCANCHTNIAAQWERSAHAIAWTNPEFVLATDGRSIARCLPCHASRPLLEQPPGEPARLRDHQRQYGVECRTCHQLGEAYAGPYESRIGPHPAVQDTVRLPCSDFCGICHAMESDEYTRLYLAASSSNQRTCAQCHMPTSRERLTQGHVLSYIHPKRAVHDHAFPVWAPVVAANAVEIGSPAVTRAEGRSVEVSLTLTNRGAGHRIPSGAFGYRELRVAVDLLDRHGRAVGQAEQAVLPGDDLSLAPAVATPYTLFVAIKSSEPIERIRVLVERVNRDRSFQYTLAEGEWPVADAPGR
jgi:hypothetical protein